MRIVVRSFEEEESLSVEKLQIERLNNLYGPG